MFGEARENGRLRRLTRRYGPRSRSGLTRSREATQNRPCAVINLISNTTNRGGLVVRARLDRRRYATGKKVSAAELRALNIERDDFNGDWNYVIKPRPQPPR